MYESPIEVYIQEAVKNYEEQRDNKICQYITEEFNVNVDREELIRALNYDRGQYEKGYRDAEMEYEKKIEEMIAEIRECAYDEPEGYVCFCDREPDKIVSLEDVEEIIHKYCDKEQNNETD